MLCIGAYGAIMEEDNAADKFCEEDIDQILERRTQVITLESEKGSTFSKASFASSGIRADIDIDDPDFWKKWARRADIDTTERGEKVCSLCNSIIWILCVFVCMMLKVQRSS